MQFQIPQFIEVEDKIFGPLTFRQFVYIVGGLGASYLLYRVLPFIIALPLIGVIMGLASALAFFQYNGRPFIIALEHGFYFLVHPKLYLWNNERKRNTAPAKTVAREGLGAEIYVPKLSGSKLSELSWALDIKERIATGAEISQADRKRSMDVLSPIQTMRSAIQER